MTPVSGLTVEDVMSRNTIVVGPDDPLEEVARLMSKHNVSGFPVVGPNGEVIGVISEGDLLRRYRSLEMPVFVDILGGLFPLKPLSAVERQLREIVSTKVSEIMSQPAVTARSEWILEQAANTMIRHRINRLPVVDSANRPVGIVTRADLVRTLAGPA